MRVLLISDVYFPRVNGVSTSIRTFRNDLHAQGIQTRLIAPRYADAPETAAERDVLRIAATAVPKDPEDRRMRWRALTQALDALPAEEFDLVHIHTPFLAHYAGVRCARRAGVPCVATYHTFFEEYLHHYVPVLPRALGRFAARHFTRSQCAAVQALIAPSEPMRTVLLDYGVTTPIHVLPTGLAADRFRPGNGAAFRAQARDRATAAATARTSDGSRTRRTSAFSYRCLPGSSRSVPEALLVIAGEGPARESLRAQVAALGLSAQVHFAGYLERDTELLDCYAAADVFVFASRTETQGLVLLEAMAQGTPVVSTAELGTRSILVPESGALVVPEEAGEFAAAVVRVLRDARLRAELSGQGRAYARGWSSAAMARRLAELYGQLCAQHAGVRASVNHFT